MHADPYHPLYLKGIEHFNHRRFFESHETWEELWKNQRGPSRQFYQGLIQTAVALHHAGHGNVRGARTLLARARQLLEPYQPWHLGLDIADLLRWMDGSVAGGGAAGSAAPWPEGAPQLCLKAPDGGAG